MSEEVFELPSPSSQLAATVRKTLGETTEQSPLSLQHCEQRRECYCFKPPGVGVTLWRREALTLFFLTVLFSIQNRFVDYYHPKLICCCPCPRPPAAVCTPFGQDFAVPFPWSRNHGWLIAGLE